MSVLDWLPDWKDESQYPAVECMSSIQWAWEFLRRNPDYQADFARFSDTVSGGSLTEEEKHDRTGEIRAKWSISMQLDPSTPSTHETILRRHFRTRPSGAFRILPGDLLRRIPGMTTPELTAPNVLAVFIDVSKPLADQLARAEQVATMWQEDWLSKSMQPPSGCKTKNYRPQDYPVYLRILDALACGETVTEIAECLFGTDEDAASAYRKAMRNRKAALELRNGGYLEISRIAKDCEDPISISGLEGESRSLPFFPLF